MANPDQKIVYTKLFIDNEFVDAVSKKTFPTTNPTTGRLIVQVAEGDKEDVDIAVQAAKRAFARDAEWRTIRPQKRADLMIQLANLMDRDKDVLANLEVIDNGKPFPEAVFDIDCAIDTIKYYAEWLEKFCSVTIPVSDVITFTKKEPIGVVGQIIPWNYPILILVWKWGPALAAGCTVVLKTAEQTPLSALHMAALTKEAGFPSGVINVISGYGPTAGAAIASHPDVKKIAFTGSVEVGRIIMELAAKSNLKRVSLELGGKCPLVVFDDVDVDKAVEIAHAALFANHGQGCCAGSKTFVHEKIYDEFLAKAVEKAKQRKVGNPFEKDVRQGPQINEEQLSKILGYIKDGVKEGARLECGGKQIGKVGYFLEPTIFSNVQDNMKLAEEEIFGPVQTIFKFSTLDEAVERANKSTYGLAAGVLTNDTNKAVKFANSVEARSLWINCYNAIYSETPFEDYKQSGFCREWGKDGIDDYLETKTTVINFQ